MSTKVKLLVSAKKLFSKNGFEGTTVRDICEDAGVAVSGIKYHFESKEGLLLKIFEEFSERQLKQTYSSLNEPKTLEGFSVRLEMFMDSVLASYLEDPETFRLIQKEIDNHNPNIEEVFKNTTLKMVEHLIAYFEAARKAGLIDSNTDVMNACGILLNHISNQVRNDDITKKYYGITLEDEAYRKGWIDSTLTILINGIRPTGEVNGKN